MEKLFSRIYIYLFKNSTNRKNWMIILIAILESWKFEKSREKLKPSILFICASVIGSYKCISASYYMLILSEDLF